jgi:hypothetical protein
MRFRMELHLPFCQNHTYRSASVLTSPTNSDPYQIFPSPIARSGLQVMSHGVANTNR